MSRIDDLIAELCPDGVEYRALGDLGVLVRGNGMPKTDFTVGGVGCIHYGQIYTYYGTWTTETKSFVAPATATKLAKVDPGDLIITNTSENLDDVCKAVAWLGTEQIVTGGHATVLKHGQDPKYLAYYLQTPEFFAKKKKHATGTKVIDVSANSLAKIRIPVPPLEVQREIVKVLDTFTALEAELEAELEARRRQYAHYRDALLTFSERERERVGWGQMSDLGILYGGLVGKTKADFHNGGSASFVTYVDVFGSIATRAGSGRVQMKLGERQTQVRLGDVLFTASSESAQDVAMSSAVTEEPAGALYLNSFCFGFRPHDLGILTPGFAKHLFRSGGIRRQLVGTASGVTRFNVSKERFGRVTVPLPSAVDQARIVAILDNFDALVNDLSVGLPAELAARRRQYEHYRDRLLTFKEVA